jgi:hypothetical protein
MLRAENFTIPDIIFNLKTSVESVAIVTGASKMQDFSTFLGESISHHYGVGSLVAGLYPLLARHF